eukprot:jgi/Psemu1/233520/estExt_Genewise1.C_50104
MIRLSKRMGELDMFSRREADRLIQDGRILLDGEVVEVGCKVPSDLENQNSNICRHNAMAAVVLNKPKGYVSGQAEHGHPPAIRLLISTNRIRDENERQENMNIYDREDSGFSRGDDNRRHFSDWKGLAPAGRLDLDSTGLLVFTRNGVLAKKLVGASSSVEKEYIVDVEPAINQQPFDLSRILRGGEFLLGDDRPLKACPKARWITEGKRLQIVLTEGRRHHIRRLCRELLGYHVVGLQRVRIGPIELPPEGVLPEGCWRPLRQCEVQSLLADSRQ